MSAKSWTMAILLALTLPAFAFWVDGVMSNRAWYMKDPGALGALVQAFQLSYFVSPLLLIAQLIILVSGWKNLTVGLRVVASFLVFATFAWMILPFMISIG